MSNFIIGDHQISEATDDHGWENYGSDLRRLHDSKSFDHSKQHVIDINLHAIY